MAITRDYSAMLQRIYRPKLIENEYDRRNYFFNRLSKKTDWNGGEYKFAFETYSEQSSFSMSSLLESAVIGQTIPTEGTISAPSRFRGSLKWREEDLKEHEGKKATYLKSLIKQTSKFLDRSAEIQSRMLLIGDNIAPFASDHANLSTGVVQLDIQSLMILRNGMYVEVYDEAPTTAVAGYIRAMDKNLKTVTIYDARTGGSAVDLSAFATADNAGIFVKGGSAESTFNLKSILLPATADGDASIYGVTKAGTMHLEAYHESGASYTTAKFHEQLLDAATESWLRDGTANTMIMSPFKKNLLLKLIDTKTQYNIMKSNEKVGLFPGEVLIEGPQHDLRVMGMKECPDDLIFGLDFSSMRLMSNGMIEIMKDPGTNSPFYRTREATGYHIITDICLNSALEVYNPACNFIISGLQASLK